MDSAVAEDPFNRSEIPNVLAVVLAECWLEGERSGTAVDPADEVVQKRVAEIIPAGAGAQLRRRIEAASAET